MFKVLKNVIITLRHILNMNISFTDVSPVHFIPNRRDRGDYDGPPDLLHRLTGCEIKICFHYT